MTQGPHDRTETQLTPLGGWVRHLMRGIRPYMDRYSLRRQNTSGANPWRIYINHFLAPDDPGHHNHPSAWSFSIPLWGSYTEEVLTLPAEGLYCGDHSVWTWQQCGKCRTGEVRTRHVRWFNWIPADKYHCITKLHPSRWGGRGVVTLFVCGPLTGRGWGWWIPGRGHVPFVAEPAKK